jgi:tetratricopeptide (TPR) repeat protein
MPPTREQLIRQATSFRAARQHDEAANAWKKAIAVSPDEPALYHNWAAALGDLHRHAEAALAIEAGFAKGLNAHQSYLVLARAKAGMLSLGEASEAYRRYLSSASEDVTAHAELAELVWMQTGDVGKSLEALDDALARLPEQVGLIVTRCRLIGEMGDRHAEYAGLQAALDRFGDVSLVLSAASAAALACGKLEAATCYAAQVAAKRPDDPDALSAYAEALICTGAYEPAQVVINRLRGGYPHNQYYIALQGDLWRLTGSDRRQEWYDYDRLVFRAPLEAPPGWSSAAAYVEDLTAALQARHCYRAHPFFQSVRQGSQISSITSFEDPAMSAYGGAIERAAGRFARQLIGMAGPACERSLGSARLFSAWSVLLPPNGFHADHVHPEGWVSSACHLVHDAGNDDTRGGWLKFGESPLPTSAPLAAEYFVEPEKGVAVLFPSYMWHGTVPFREGKSRLTVAADFVPE